MLHVCEGAVGSKMPRVASSKGRGGYARVLCGCNSSVATDARLRTAQRTFHLTCACFNGVVARTGGRSCYLRCSFPFLISMLIVVQWLYKCSVSVGVVTRVCRQFGRRAPGFRSPRFAWISFSFVAAAFVLFKSWVYIWRLGLLCKMASTNKIHRVIFSCRW